MLFNCILQHFSGLRMLTPMLDITFQVKRLILIIAALLSISTIFTYLLVANSCSAWAYVAFSLAEYILIGLNSVFYFLLVYELPRASLEIHLSGVHYVQDV
uniref:MARVEL domain-containing protein n=1 Tax=Acrobeloides nanus TaxID=290746 RepID=A0A914DYZ7_9BILA